MLDTVNASPRATSVLTFLAVLGALAFLSSIGAATAKGDEKLTVPDLRDKLKDKHKEVRLRAAKILGDYGTAAKDAVPDLIESLRDKDIEVRSLAGRALAQIGPSAVPALRDALKDEQAQIRTQVAETLGVLAPDVKDAIPPLLDAVHDKEPRVRVVALRALLAADVESRLLEPVLDEIKKDPNPYLSMLASLGLEHLKNKADGKRIAPPINQLAVFAIPQLTREQEAKLDEIVELFLVAESHDQDAIRRLPVPWPVAMQTGLCALRLGPEGIPALYRGMKKAAALGYGCSYGSLGWTLQTVIPACNDPRQLDFIVKDLGTVNPHTSLLDADYINGLRALCVQRKAELQLMLIAAEKQAEFNRTVEKLMELSDAELLKVFKDKSADVRLAALTAAAAKRLHAEDDLIERLNDTDPRVVQLARQSLMRLSRGTDLGPVADAGQLLRQTSQKRWREWWSHQDQNPNATKTDDPPMIVVTSAGEDAAAAAKLVADLKEGEGDAAGRAAALKALRETKGVAFTDALAGAVAKLEGEARDQARTALEDRLAKLSIQALHEKLLDADAEVRRAAAAAVGQKMDRAFAPELIALLSDGETDVAKAAQAALRSLSGEDFGPKDGADERAQKEAIKKWRAWWTKMQDK
jgi:HEAT repeat protein